MSNLPKARKVRRALQAAQPPKMPPAAPETDGDKAMEMETLRLLDEINDRLLQRNLDRAVKLAIQAANRRGPLIDHFDELGRRFASELDHKPAPKLRVITGGIEGAVS